jgi:Uma2 family endonuclease
MVTEVLSHSLPATNGRRVTSCLVPPLQSGDHLTRDEFERRYEAMPHVKKAELIEGVVYMSSLVRVDVHAEPHSWVTAWVAFYAAMTPGVRVGDNGTVRLDPNNEPQPDVMLWIDEKRGGQAIIGEKGYMEGAPDLVVEVAASSASYDLHEKLRVYQRNGVREYLVWSVFDEQFRWFRLSGRRYVEQTPGAGGIIASRVFPGLRLNVAALLRGELSQVLADLQAGIASPAHADFVRRLQESQD